MLMARELLTLCTAAHKMLDDEQGEQQWDVIWWGALSLIRAVGHALRVDDDPAVLSISNELHKEWTRNTPEHLIFREFIVEDRNLLLKELSSRVYGAASTAFVVDEETAELGGNLYRPFEDGPWAGEDARDVYEMAIQWWSKQLDIIEERLQARPSRAR